MSWNICIWELKIIFFLKASFSAAVYVIYPLTTLPMADFCVPEFPPPKMFNLVWIPFPLSISIYFYFSNISRWCLSFCSFLSSSLAILSSFFFSSSAILISLSCSLLAAFSAFLRVSFSILISLATFSASSFNYLSLFSSASFASLSAFSWSLILSLSSRSSKIFLSFSTRILLSSSAFSSRTLIFSTSSRSLSIFFSSLLLSNSIFLYKLSSSSLCLLSYVSRFLVSAFDFFSLNSFYLLSTTGLHFGQNQSTSSSGGCSKGNLFLVQYLSKHFSMWNDRGQLSQQISSPPSLQTLQWSLFSTFRVYYWVVPSKFDGIYELFDTKAF